MILKIILYVSLVVNCVKSDEVSCTTKFCDDYLNKNSCPEIPDNCNIQNATNSGTFLPYAGPCQCCDFCLDNLKKGDACSVGSSSSPLATNICGDELSCVDKKCDTIVSACTDAQNAYDQKKKDGQLGHMEVRPICDADGKFKSAKCIPNEICYCLDEKSNRIFGEIPYSSIAELQMKCGCSRYFHTAKEMTEQNLYTLNRFRCMPNGDFDELQCIGDSCYCVDAADGTPSYPGTAAVNVSQVSSKTLPCFNSKIHIPYFYYYDCEYELNEKLMQLKEMKDDGYEVISTVLPNCNLEGKYALVQINDTHKYCSDSNGTPLENFAVDIASAVSNMNCFCAKARSLIDAVEKPTCLENGNYNPVQCRRGMCRCVDENGNQNVLEVPYEEKDTLKCP